jgi:ethanolamine utilization cobalamin adenosyltransferase
MLYTLEDVKANVRNREGKRVFYLAPDHRLTPGARDWLAGERIEILSAELAKPDEYRLLSGAVIREKPEHITHLYGNVLVPKTHPRIAFRGAVDTLEAELLLAQIELCKPYDDHAGQILELARRLIRCDVLSEPVPEEKLCGLTEKEQRERSHRPQDFYGQPHFMPSAGDGRALLQLNRARCAARAAELKAVEAFSDRDGNPTRPDILRALNRLSSMIYILMIQIKAGKV